MKKYLLPMSWPKRDPLHYRFPIPNSIWEHRLKPVEFVLLSYLCCQRSHGNTALSPEMIAKGIHMTAATVKKYLVSLIDRKLIADEYFPSLSFQCIDNSNFFTLPNEIFLLNLPPSAFMVYAYLLLVEDRRTHTCHPSYNIIADKAGLSKNTTMKCISALLDVGLITMEHSCYFDQHGMKWKGNNLYTILPTQRTIEEFHQRQLRQSELDSERRRTRKRQAQFARSYPGMALNCEALCRPP